MTDPLCVLASYYYLTPPFLRKMANFASRTEVFIDSGAYTAWTKKETVRLDGYTGFLADLPFKPARYLVLDVIGDGEATRANYETMLDAGLEPVPIVTRGDDPSAVDRYFETSDLVGLGGVTAADISSAAWFGHMMGVVGTRKAHILGMTRLEWVKKLRPWSIDSSSWLAGARYGIVTVYMGHGQWKRIVPREQKGRIPVDVAGRIRRYGFDPYSIVNAKAQKGIRSLTQQINTASWVEYAIEQRQAIGTRLFLAVATETWFDMLIEAFDRVIEARKDRVATTENSHVQHLRCDRP